jgi:hypothetical protein
MTFPLRARRLAALAPLAVAAAALAPTTTPALAACSSTPSNWTTQPRLVLHLGELYAPGTEPDDATLFGQELLTLAQVTDAVNQFNAIGGTTARVTGVTTTFDPFTYKGSYNDPVPTIHVGFQPNAKITSDNKGNGAAALTTTGLYLSSNCSPTRTIEMHDMSQGPWSLKSPFMLANQGARYYDAGTTAPDSTGGGEWLRPSFLHELLHAFGLEHTKTEYSMLNHRGSGDPHGGFPWANRGDADAVRPLPYEIGLLRGEYPASDAHWDVTVLNTWFNKVKGDDAAHQVQLCTPSLGTKFTKNRTVSDACGHGGPDGGSAVVAENDLLRTRFTLANASTGSMQVTSKLWLSTDDVLSDGDIPALTWDVRTVSADTSELAEVTFKVPHLPPGNYRPIVVIGAEHVNPDGSIDPHSPLTDWMPLRGTVCSPTSFGLCFIQTKS